MHVRTRIRLLKLQITRPALARWLRARPSPASRWNDWRAIGGQWYLGGNPTTLAEASETVVRDLVAAADADLASYADNREMLHSMLADRAEAPELRLSAFDETGRIFVAGSLTWSESIGDFIVFLALARSAADHLEPSGHGLAIVHNYLWGAEDAQETTAALRMMPTGESQLLPRAEWASVAPAFQPIADALIDGRLPSGFPMRDQLRTLG